MPSVIIEGQQLHYVDQGQGFPVLLGHSYLWSAEMWQPQIDALSQHYRVIVPDLWGHGRSGKLPEGSDSLTSLARHHLALLDALDIPHSHLIGLSIGGMWGAELAAMAPERVSRLVLMDTWLGAESEDARGRYFALMDQIDQADSIPPPLLDIITPMFFHPDGQTVPEQRRAFRAHLSNLSSVQLRESILPLGRLLFGRSDRCALLDSLDAQATLVMAGDRDIPRPVHEAKEMASRVGCDFVAIPHAGHISNLENEEFVTDTLLSWLAT